MKFNSENAKSMEELRVIVDHLEGRMATDRDKVNFGEPVAMAAEVTCHLVAHVEALAHGKRTAPYVAAALVAAAEVIRDVHVTDEGDGTYFDTVVKVVRGALVNSMTAVALRMPETDEDVDENGDET